MSKNEIPNTDDAVAVCEAAPIMIEGPVDVDATGVTSEQFCTVDCETVTVFYCKDDGVLGLEPIAHILPGTTAAVAGPYTGAVVDCSECVEALEIEKPDQWLTGCRNGCEPVDYCLDGDGVIVKWRDATGAVTLGDMPDISPGQCPTAIPECVRLWGNVDGEAVLQGETTKFVSFAGEFFNLNDGSKGDKAGVLAQFGLDVTTGFCTACDVDAGPGDVPLVPCPVAPPVDGVWATCSIHHLSFTACMPDCDDETATPVTVEWKGVTLEVPAGSTWSTPDTGCDPIEGDITVVGEVIYHQAWTLEPSTQECEEL